MAAVETWLLSCLLNSLWQIPLLFVGGLLVARALRGVGPGAEHRAWVTVLLLSVILPAASSLSLNFLTKLAWLFPPHADEGQVAVFTGPGLALNSSASSHGWLAAIAWIYAAVCLWFVARLVWQCARLRTIRRCADRIDLAGDAASSWRRCRESLSSRNVVLASSPRIFGPITIGIVHRLIVLPARLLSSADAADLEAVFAHELAHIRRHDFAKNLLCELIALPVSYHPLLWGIRERILVTREMICDEIAAQTAPRRQYARSLLRLANLLLEGRPVTTPYAVGIFDSHSFERRLMRLTETAQPICGLRRIAVIAACALFGIGVGSSAIALHVRVNAPEAESKAQPSGPIAVSPKIMQGQRVNGPVPVYPPEAKKARIQGKVLLNALIGKDGTVEHLTVASGPDALQKSALDAVRQWTYKPFLLNGEPVEVKTTITVVYSLSK